MKRLAVSVYLASATVLQSAWGASTVTQLDQFGQNATANFRGKVTSKAALKELDFAEEADLQRHPEIERKAPITAVKAGAPSFFKVQKIKGRWWLLSPSGDAFYSLGIDCISPFSKGRDGTTHYKNNLIVKWGKKNYLRQFYQRAVARCHSWGFNTLGNWCDEGLIAKRTMPYVHVGPKTWKCKVPYIDGDICDVFHPDFNAETIRVSRELSKSKNDKLLVGYFLDNELPWWNLGYDVLSMRKTAHARRELIRQLKNKYGTIATLNSAWKTDAASFAQLRWPGDGKSAAADKDLAEYRGRFAERFYGAWYAAIKRADPNHLVLGSRIPYPMDEVVAANARHTDVLSFNHYAFDVPATFDRYYKQFGKPMLIGEYAFDSLDAGLLGAHIKVRSQVERGVGYRFITEQLAAKPYFVGAHYFQYVDEPVNGRDQDGENSFNGFVSVCDVPYLELVKAARITNARIYDVHAGILSPTTRHPAR